MKFDKLRTTGVVWITSDTHYHHKNICRGVTNWRTQDGNIPVNSTRDFRDLDEMDVAIVNNINSKVMFPQMNQDNKRFDRRRGPINFKEMKKMVGGHR